MSFIESVFKMKLMRRVMVSVLVCSAAAGYAIDGEEDLSKSPVTIKQADQTLLAAPKQDFDFDDSNYSSLTNSFASSANSLAQKKSPKSVNEFLVSGESRFSTRSTMEFTGGNYRVSLSDQLFLTDLERVLLIRAQEENESVQSSGVFSQLRESGISVYSSAEWSKGGGMSLFELLPDLAYRFNLTQSLDFYQSMSLDDLLKSLGV